VTAAELKADFSRTSIAGDSRALADRIQRGRSCARCGRYAAPERMKCAVTGNLFCADEKACRRRAERRAAIARGSVTVAVAQ
jgi:uncharacterized OB-fold protein